eukprot:TRINITY_DN18381_c0_g1_i1.p1 TRINITY_DN18381_c0_g1~~TRINITY_DN18381_c0_g1_i1.p1  ORF type:complete len:176 (+),score=33.76 TRINITY_DN18381_c0_g1_i1:30-557(+)
MDSIDFELLETKVLEAEVQRRLVNGHIGLPPPGWSPAKAAAQVVSDRAALRGNSSSPLPSTSQRLGADGVGQRNIRRGPDADESKLVCVLERLEGRELKTPSNSGSGKDAPKAPVLYLYGVDEPVEMAPAEPQRGPIVPFRLREAKLLPQASDSIYFGRITKDVDTSETTVSLFV